MVFKSQHISKTIFKENFSKRYSIVFSGSRDSHDIYKWVATQRSLGTAELTNINIYDKNVHALKFTHSFIPGIYIAPLQETYSEALSVQLRPKRNVLRSLQKEDALFRGSKRSVRGSYNTIQFRLLKTIRIKTGRSQLTQPQLRPNT